MKILNVIKERYKNPLSSFSISVLLFLLLCIAKGIHPFGEKSILQVDLFHQYAPFHEELRSRILNGQSIIYSWEGGLGKVFFTQLAYYTASPLSFLVLLFPSGMLPNFILLLVVIKLSFAAFTFTWFLENHFEKRDRFVVLWGLLYAFSAFMMAYYWNVMWLDNLALFPLVATGIDNLLRKKDGRLYLVSLAISIICNFYIAFLVCVGSVLYFVVRALCTYEIKKDCKTLCRMCMHYVGLSAVAGGIAMFLVIPSALALAQTVAGNTTVPTFGIYRNVWQMFESHLMGAVPQVLVSNEQPANVYCGLVPLILAPYFFLNKEIGRRKKVLYGGVMLFLILCCVIKPLDYLIHGAHFPANLPHRFMFIYIFFLLFIAYYGWLHLSDVPKKEIIFATITWVIVLLVSECIIVPLNKNLSPLFTSREITCNILLMALYAVLLLRCRTEIKVKGAAGLLAILMLAECFYSGYNGFVKSTNYQSYVNNQEPTLALIKELDEEENGNFYRMEFRRLMTVNDAALFHYRGLSAFSSMTPGGISRLMEKLGFSAASNSYRYYDPTPLLDAIFNIRYIIEKTDDGNGGMKNPYYKYRTEFQNIELYENERALDIGYMVSSDILDWKTTDSMPFDVQNDLAKKAGGTKRDMFRVLPVENIVVRNLTITDRDTGNHLFYRVPEPYKLQAVPEIQAQIPISEEGHYFLWIQAPSSKRVVYEFEGQKQDRELTLGKSLIDLRVIPAGKTLTVIVAMNSINENEVKYADSGELKLYLAKYDDSVFKEVYDTLSEGEWKVTNWGDTFMEGMVESEKEGILFTSIPYEKSWQLFVDGKKEQIVALGDEGLIGASLIPGTHSVRLEFHLRGLPTGICVTALSLIVSAVYFYFFSIKKTRRDENVRGN